MNFENYLKDANTFVNQLASELGHPEEKEETKRVLRSVMHTLRDQITLEENIHVVAQLPIMLKGIYVDDWKVKEKPDRLKTVEEFAARVKEYQTKYGENEFTWNEPTEEIIRTTIRVLASNYITEGELNDVLAQLPEEIEMLVGEGIQSSGW